MRFQENVITETILLTKNSLENWIYKIKAFGGIFLKIFKRLPHLTSFYSILFIFLIELHSSGFYGISKYIIKYKLDFKYFLLIKTFIM